MTATRYLLEPMPIHVGAHKTQVRRAMQACVDRIIDRLANAGIPYCLLRNRDRIPGGLLGWTDLDLMIPDTVQYQRILSLFADLSPALVYPVRRGFVVLFFPVEDRFLRVDVFNGDIEWRAAAYGRNQEILAGRWDDNGIMVASPLHQAVLAWFSRLLQHGDMPTRYVPQVTSCAHAYPGEVCDLLTETFGDDNARRLIRFATAGAPEMAEFIVPSLRKSLWLRTLRRHPIDTLARCARQVGNTVEHRLHPAGLSVAIVGPDPEANAALCARIASLPSRMVPFVIVDYMPPGRHRSLLRLWLQELLRTRRRLAHAKLVVRDYHPVAEFLAGETDGRRSARSRRASLLGRFAPGSNLVIILDMPDGAPSLPRAAVPSGREPEREATTRLLADRLPDAVVIDGSRAPDDVLTDILGIINRVAIARTRDRFGLTPQEQSSHHLHTEPAHGVTGPILPETGWADAAHEAERH